MFFSRPSEEQAALDLSGGPMDLREEARHGSKSRLSLLFMDTRVRKTLGGHFFKQQPISHRCTLAVRNGPVDTLSPRVYLELCSFIGLGRTN